MNQSFDNENLSELLATGNDDHVMLHHVVGFYYRTLKQSPNALKYLHKRAISSEAVDYFKIGYSNRTLGTMLPEKNRKQGAASRGHLQRLGVLRPNGREHLRGSIVVAMFNGGVVKVMYGRKTTNKVRAGTPLHLYIPETRPGIFNLEAIEVSEELILCQSIFDALTFWSANFRNVTCCFGLDSSMSELVTAIESHSVKRVLIAFENSKNGNTAADNISSRLLSSGIDCYRIEFPEDMDANSLATNHPPASESLGAAIRQAVWLGKGLEKSEKTDPAAALTDPAEKTEESQNTRGSDAIDSTVENESTVDELEQPQTGVSAEITQCSVALENQDNGFESLPATVFPPSILDTKAEIRDEDILIHLDNRRYRIRGLEKNLSVDQLKVNILLSTGDSMFVDTFDLYTAKQRALFIRQAFDETRVPEKVLKRDLGKVLLKLEQLQDDFIQQAMTVTPKIKTLSKTERKEALSLLQDPDLVQRIVDDFDRCGVIGEKTNKLMGYIATLSRKLDKPLALMVQSTSAAGKTALMDAVLSFVPEEDCIQYSAITGQSLFYMSDMDVKNKILAIREERGACNASYALKLLQSDGKLTIATTGKEAKNGRLATQEHTVEGPLMIFSTTTALDIDEELLNRCMILTVDEDRAQTRAIHELQRFEETLEGLMARQERDDLVRVHRNAQRLIRPLKVVNPYAQQLTFLNDQTRTRRDHKKYLTMIRTIALLHQHQREIKSTYFKGEPLEYIEVTLEDIAIANQLAHEVLGRSLDELPQQTRRLLMHIHVMVTENCDRLKISQSEFRFTRRDVREYTGWGDTQLKVHLKRLETMEYLLVHRSCHSQRMIYELLYSCEGQDGSAFMMGLMDVNKLKQSQPQDIQNRSQTGRAQVGPLSAFGRTLKDAINTYNNNQLPIGKPDSDAEPAIYPSMSPASYTHSVSGSLGDAQ